MEIFVFLIIELVVILIQPAIVLVMKQNYKSAFFLGGVLFAGSAMGSVFFDSSQPLPGGIHFGYWTLVMAGILFLESYLFYRFVLGVGRASSLSLDQGIQLKKKEVDKVQEHLAKLKVELQQQEDRLREALKFYNIAWDLAECLGFDQMKRVLERELKNFMPQVAGFAVYVKNEQTGYFEPQIRHRLWLDGDQWVHPEGVLIREPSHPIASKDSSGKSLVVSPISMGGKLLGYFVGDIIAPAQLKHDNGQPNLEDILLFAATLSEELKFGVVRATNFARVEQLSRMDSLTGLHRRGIFDQRIKEELIRAQTFKSSVCLMMLDIDHFKNLNDQWGHLFGDTVLRKVSNIIGQSIYETDFVARYGGEEFAIILPRAMEEGAFRKADMIRQKVEREIILSEDNGEAIRCTISIGIAFYPQDATNGESLIARADRALYASKSAGRNRTTTFSSLAM